MKKLVFQGAATALVTPFNRDCSVNYKKLEELTEIQISGGIDALVVCGTTGESAVLSDEEHSNIIKIAKKSAKGRIPVIAGAGSNNTLHAVTLAKNAESAGADALLVVTPYYNKTSQRGLVAHYTTVADSVGIPVIVYNVPSRTGVNIKPETYARLAEHKNIVGAKEANGDLSALAESISLCGDRLVFFSGSDDLIVPFLSLGAKGVISVMSNLLPAETHTLCNSCLSGDFWGGAAAQLKYIRLIKALFSDVNPVPVKTAMNICGLDVGPVRPPLYPMTDFAIRELDAELKRIL